ncbi:putative transcription factor interactor and regulator CCHC(Zn) family [Helianthus annuus]|nr:putative transcription factor interactor and regulator CCHC(Zn) family [Helianthus annuus]KAJ0519565.1 putative transcription factor interactor and regulator CCHC(Zn) family [Helianthus annuus]KAJ0691358.1 putative transcription factor interactor and regulator CCHC(Zn) family [Helianthus annuus]
MKYKHIYDESSLVYEDDMHDKFPLPTSGIRATPDYKGDRIYEFASVLPCKHCSDEQRERSMTKVIQKRCYYCNQPGHQIAYCKEKENDEAYMLIRQATETGIQKQDDAVVRSSEYKVNGIDGGLWLEIWYVNTSFKHHYSGNLNSFKRIRNMFGVETNTGENQFYFIRGIGAVDITSGSEKFRIQGVYYTPELDRNVLSLDQLIFQGYTVKFNGERCKITPLVNKRNNITGLTREDEIGSNEKQSIIDRETEHENFKSDYLNHYIERLNLTSNEPDWNMMILQCMKFKEFQDCKALLDMLDDGEYVMKFKYEIERKFEEMIIWFLHD